MFLSSESLGFSSLVELLIAAPAARELGAQRVLLVCPYLAYMRQDIAFEPGEVIRFDDAPGLGQQLGTGALRLKPSVADDHHPIGDGLDLGLDSVLFVDDSPHERDAMRRLCPQVRVPEMPADVAQRPGWLSHDLLLLADPSGPRTARLGESLAECAERFLGAAIQDCVVIDPAAPARGRADPALLRLLRAQLAHDLNGHSEPMPLRHDATLTATH
mgnify:CR=1 FL=1